MRNRYAQCDDTCTVDCGACKGQGRPVVPPPNPLLMVTLDGNPAVSLNARPPEPTEGQRQRVQLVRGEMTLADLFHERIAERLGDCPESDDENDSLCWRLAFDARTVLAEAEARGHARGVAEAGALRERVAVVDALVRDAERFPTGHPLNRVDAENLRRALDGAE